MCRSTRNANCTYQFCPGKDSREGHAAAREPACARKGSELQPERPERYERFSHGARPRLLPERGDASTMLARGSSAASWTCESSHTPEIDEFTPFWFPGVAPGGSKSQFDHRGQLARPPRWRRHQLIDRFGRGRPLALSRQEHEIHRTHHGRGRARGGHVLQWKRQCGVRGALSLLHKTKTRCRVSRLDTGSPQISKRRRLLQHDDLANLAVRARAHPHEINP